MPEEEFPPRPLRYRLWFRVGAVMALLLLVGAVKLPLESRLTAEHRAAYLHGAKLDLSLRRQTGFIAALGGFRAEVADLLWIEAHIDWTRTEWGKMLDRFNLVTALEPRNVLFWDMAAWHMGWNASAAAINDPTQPYLALRMKRQHAYFMIARDLLQRGIQNNPDKYKLYESLATLDRDKLQDHCSAAVEFKKAGSFTESPDYNRRFAAYELAHCPGHEREAYKELVRLYNLSVNERLPRVYQELKTLQESLNIPEGQRIKIPESELPKHRIPP